MPPGSPRCLPSSINAMRHLLCTLVFLASTAALAQPTIADLSPDVWVRQVNTDKMTGKAGWSASIWSSDKVSLPSPYQGAQQIMLNLGRAPEGEVFAFVAVVRGQMSCRDCDVRVRFDDDQPETFTGLAPLQATGIMYLRGAERFIRKARAAKVVLVEVPFFRAGAMVVTFKTEGMPAE